MLDFAQARRMMVDSQLRTFDVFDLAVLAAMDTLPRERFVPRGREALAYIDRDLPIGDGEGGDPRRMLSPMVLGRLIQGLEVERGQRALDVACGLGYSSAVLASLGAAVTALEASEALADEARQRLEEAGIAGVEVVAAPLDRGWPAGAPYDAILVNGAVEVRPQALLDQLADGGRLACLERNGSSVRAQLYTRSGDAFGARALFDASAPTLAAFRAPPVFTF